LKAAAIPLPNPRKHASRHDDVFGEHFRYVPFFVRMFVDEGLFFKHDNGPESSGYALSPVREKTIRVTSGANF